MSARVLRETMLLNIAEAVSRSQKRDLPGSHFQGRLNTMKKRPPPGRPTCLGDETTNRAYARWCAVYGAAYVAFVQGYDGTDPDPKTWAAEAREIANAAENGYLASLGVLR